MVVTRAMPTSPAKPSVREGRKNPGGATALAFLSALIAALGRAVPVSPVSGGHPGRTTAPLSRSSGAATPGTAASEAVIRHAMPSPHAPSAEQALASGPRGKSDPTPMPPVLSTSRAPSRTSVPVASGPRGATAAAAPTQPASPDSGGKGVAQVSARPASAAPPLPPPVAIGAPASSALDVPMSRASGHTAAPTRPAAPAAAGIAGAGSSGQGPVSAPVSSAAPRAHRPSAAPVGSVPLSSTPASVQAPAVAPVALAAGPVQGGSPVVTAPHPGQAPTVLVPTAPAVVPTPHALVLHLTPPGSSPLTVRVGVRGLVVSAHLVPSDLASAGVYQGGGPAVGAALRDHGLVLGQWSVAGTGTSGAGAGGTGEGTGGGGWGGTYGGFAPGGGPPSGGGQWRQPPGQGAGPLGNGPAVVPRAVRRVTGSPGIVGALDRLL